MNKSINKKRNSDSGIIKAFEENVRKRFGITTKVTKRAIHYAAMVDPDDEEKIVLILWVNWREYFRHIPNFKVEVINERLVLTSDKKLWKRND